jgi:hypothetical protein
MSINNPKAIIHDINGAVLVGQKAMIESLPVALSSDQAAIPVNLVAAAEPYFYSIFDRIVPAANKYMATVFNPLGSGKLLKIKRIYVLNWQNAGNQSATLDQYAAIITARTVGTTVPIRKFRRSDPTNSVVSASTNASGVVEAYLFRRFFAAINSVNLANANWFNALAFAVNGEVFSVRNDVKSLELDPGEGIALRNVTSNTSGSVSYVIEWSEGSL